MVITTIIAVVVIAFALVKSTAVSNKSAGTPSHTLSLALTLCKTATLTTTSSSINALTHTLIYSFSCSDSHFCYSCCEKDYHFPAARSNSSGAN